MPALVQLSPYRRHFKRLGFKGNKKDLIDKMLSHVQIPYGFSMLTETDERNAFPAPLVKSSHHEDEIAATELLRLLFTWTQLANNEMDQRRKEEVKDRILAKVNMKRMEAEVYLQLLKQTRRNPDHNSACCVWNLFAEIARSVSCPRVHLLIQTQLMSSRRWKA